MKLSTKTFVWELIKVEDGYWHFVDEKTGQEYMVDDDEFPTFLLRIAAQEGGSVTIEVEDEHEAHSIEMAWLNQN